jgi:hypothetical protein
MLLLDRTLFRQEIAKGKQHMQKPIIGWVTKGLLLQATMYVLCTFLNCICK